MGFLLGILWIVLCWKLKIRFGSSRSFIPFNCNLAYEYPPEPHDWKLSSSLVARGIYVDHRHLILKPCKLQSLEDPTSQQVGWLHQHMAVRLYNFNLQRRFIHHLAYCSFMANTENSFGVAIYRNQTMTRLLAPFDPLKRAVSNTWKNVDIHDCFRHISFENQKQGTGRLDCFLGCFSSTYEMMEMTE